MSLQDCSYGDVVHQFEKRCKKSLVAKKTAKQYGGDGGSLVL